MEIPSVPGSVYNKNTQTHTVYYYCCYSDNLYSPQPNIAVSAYRSIHSHRFTACDGLHEKM